MKLTKHFLFGLLFQVAMASFSQTSIDTLLRRVNPQKLSILIEKKVNMIEEKIIVKSEKALIKLEKQEENIYKRLLRTKDSLQARTTLGAIKSKYQSLRDKIKSPAVVSGSGQYIAKLDTLATSLKFLNLGGAGSKVNDALNSTQILQGKFERAEEIRKFIKERKEQLKIQLQNLGLIKELKKFNKQAYYYSEQMKEYKSLLQDSKKAERKAIDLLSRTKLFQDFMRKNTLLASMFRIPSPDPLTPVSLAGLQTRIMVSNLIQQQIAMGGSNGQALFRQQMQNAQTQLQQMKNTVLQAGGSNSDDIMPDGFRPNNQKTKSFLKRIEIGTNVQSQRSTNYFPVTSDLGISFGYKLNDKSIIGIGASYKLGWGRGWNHIRLSSEGAGLRSFIDLKLKGSFWVTGGYEQNYKTAFNSIDILRELNAWQQSGLLGVTKTVNVKSKFFKKTKAQLLWDFLSYQQRPVTQPILFRIGYNF